MPAPNRRHSGRTQIIALLALLCPSIVTTARAETPVGLKGLIDNALDNVTAEDLKAHIADLKTLGITWVRYELDWSTVQPDGPDSYALDHHDMVIKALTDARINVLGLIDYTPGWANRGAATKFYPPLDNAAFAAYASHLAAHYAPMGVHTWEVWNEENMAVFWSPAANVADYAALLKAASSSIHAADPHATVMFGGLAQPSDRHGDILTLRFLDGLYKAGAQQSFEAAADHPYFSPNSPTTANGNNWQEFTTRSQVFAVLWRRMVPCQTRLSG